MEYTNNQINLKDVGSRSDILVSYYQNYPERLTVRNMCHIASWLGNNGGVDSFPDKKELRSLIMNSQVSDALITRLLLNAIPGGSE